MRAQKYYVENKSLFETCYAYVSRFCELIASGSRYTE